MAGQVLRPSSYASFALGLAVVMVKKDMLPGTNASA